MVQTRVGRNYVDQLKCSLDVTVLSLSILGYALIPLDFSDSMNLIGRFVFIYFN